MRVPGFLRGNLLLKMTSLNSIVILIRIVISAFVQNIVTRLVGESGIYTIGQLRNIIPILTSVSSFGFFNGIVKQVAENKDEKESLDKLFSTVFVITFITSIILSLVLFIYSEYLSQLVFDTGNYKFVFLILSFTVPFFALNRIFHGVINGLSDYKKFSAISLIGYIFAAIILLYGLYNFDLAGVLLAISIEPIIQLVILLFIFGRTLKRFLRVKNIRFHIPYAKPLLGFTIMSFTSTILVNYIEIDIRTSIKTIINKNDAAYWTGMIMISKNYMVFSSSIFSLYVVPRFTKILNKKAFISEVSHIYKNILPLFFVGMILIFVFRDLIIHILFPGFIKMRDLFKWQLLGDFVRLCSLVVAHLFIAKKMVKSFIFTEILSVFLFYFLSHIFIHVYGVEGIVIAHLIRFIIYFLVVLIFIKFYFKLGEN